MSGSANRSVFRPLGSALLNLVVATVGTGLAEGAVWRWVHFSSPWRGPMMAEDLVSSATAFGLGYCVYARWEPTASKWLWLAGLCWFTPRALLMLDGTHGAIWELAGPDFHIGTMSFDNWIESTLPCLRTIFYSLGAYCSARSGAPALVEKLRKRIREGQW
jgi:hypothetical protein